MTRKDRREFQREINLIKKERNNWNQNYQEAQRELSLMHDHIEKVIEEIRAGKERLVSAKGPH